MDERVGIFCISNPVGTGGVLNLCLCCSGVGDVGGDWV